MTHQSETPPPHSVLSFLQSNLHPVRIGMEPLGGKMFHGLILGTLLVLATAQLHAGSSLVLEGFENGFTTNSFGQTNLAAFTAYGTRLNGTNVTLSLYTSEGPGDPRVTEGSNSAKVVFVTDGYGNDLSFALSDAAATLVETAASSRQPGRFILRYDVVFEHIERLSFFNQIFYFGNDWDYVRSGGAIRATNNGVAYGTVSFSVPLDLPALGIPAIPPNIASTNNSGDFSATGVQGMTAHLSDQFQAITEPLNNFTIYLDNFRLIDTYETPTTEPVIYQLQSFENPANPLGGVTNLNPTGTLLSLYTTNGQYDAATDAGLPGQYTAGSPNSLAQESDFAVTDGTNALQVDCSNGFYSYDIFSLPFAGTRLAQILGLGLTRDQLAHYTIRWDVTTPMVPLDNGGADGDYFQSDYNSIGGSILPMSTGRRQYSNQLGLQRETYSLTLDQIAYLASPPALGFSCSQSGSPKATWGASPFFFDNFVLINTAPKYTYITSETFDPVTERLTLSWVSEPNQTYSIQYAATLSSGFSTSLITNLPAGGDLTKASFALPKSSSGFLRILAE